MRSAAGEGVGLLSLEDDGWHGRMLDQVVEVRVQGLWVVVLAQLVGEGWVLRMRVAVEAVGHMG